MRWQRTLLVVFVLLGSLVLLGLGLHFLLGGASPRASAPERVGHGTDGDAPGLRGTSGPLARPIDLEIHVRARAGGPPPARTIVGLTTPPVLRDGREGTLDHRFGGEDFDGSVLRVPGLRHRVWDLLIAAPGHRGVQRQFALPAEAVGVHVLEVELEAWASLDVRVFQADGRPLPGASLELVGATPAGVTGTEGASPVHPDDRPLRAAMTHPRTDRDGRSDLPLVAPDVEAVLRVRHLAHPPADRTIRTPPAGGRREVEVTLRTPSGVRGSVDLTAFAASAEAIVVSDFHHVGRAARLAARIPIQPDGSFHLRNVAPGLHTVQVASRGVSHTASALHVVRVPAGATRDLGMLAPDPGPDLTVHVHAEAPMPRGARVRCHLTVFPVDEDVAAPLDRLEYEFALPAGQEHVLRGVPAGAISVACFLVDRQGELLPSHADGKAAVAADARAQPVEIVLRLRAAQRPSAPVQVRVQPPADVLPAAFRWRLLQFDEEGHLLGATARGLRGASVRLHSLVRTAPTRFVAVAHGRVSAPVTVAEIPAAGAEVDIATWSGRAATVRVRVEDDEGTPVPDASVHVRLGADTPAALAFVVRTDASGHARFDTVPGHALVLRVGVGASADAASVRLRAGDLGAGREVPCTLRVERQP